MEVKAKLNYLRQSPRKVRLVADLIRNKKVKEAQVILEHTIKRASKPLLSLLKSAVANARNNFQIDPENLYISKILVNEGPRYKRWMPRAMGQVSEIQKKTSHITLILKEIKEETKKKTAKKLAKKTKESIKAEKGKKVKERRIEENREKEQKQERAKIKPIREKVEKEKIKPKIEKGIKRFFRRKAF